MAEAVVIVPSPERPRVTFGSPYLLTTLVIVPLAAIGYWLLERHRARRAAAWSSPGLLPNIVRRPPGRVRRLPVLLSLLAITLMLVGFARPERVSANNDLGSPTLVLVFDVSGSMAADDVGSTRIHLARQAALRLLSQLPARFQVAILKFSNNVQVLALPTLDRRLAASKIPRTVTPLGGTAIGDAINESVQVVLSAASHRETESRIPPGAVVLFSDGAQTAAGLSPGQAALSALVDDVSVDTVAIGTANGVVTQLVKHNGHSTPNRIAVPWEPLVLRSISQTTRGVSLEAGSVVRSPNQLKALYASLRPYSTTTKQAHSLSALTAILALLLILTGVAFSSFRLGKAL